MLLSFCWPVRNSVKLRHMKTKLFSALSRKIKHLTSFMKEKPSAQVDDYVLEHFLLYNGLIGSTPENQPRFRDLRADIIEAVNHGSPQELAVALKVPPLWWEERLEKIFSEIADVDKSAAIACLLPEESSDGKDETSTPLRYHDWRVRANAARMLAFLGAKEAVPTIINALQDQSEDMKAAFCHYVYALGKLGTEQARLALLPFLHDQEPWHRVDAAGALSLWPLSVVAPDLMAGMLDNHSLQDYMSVAIARKHTPLKFLEYNDSDIKSGACEMVLSLLLAAEGTFHADSSIRAAIYQCKDAINQLAKTCPTPRHLSAAIAVNAGIAGEHAGDNRNGSIHDLTDPSHRTIIESCIRQADCKTPEKIGDLKQALFLCGQFKLSSCASYLLPLLHEDFVLINEVVECAGLLSDPDLAPPIAALVRNRFNLEERSQLPLSSNPVFEDDRKAALIYWTALKSLGSLPHPVSIEILSLAVNDYAPDKREQALLALQKLCCFPELKQDCPTNLTDLIIQRLSDPASSVRLAALEGVKQHSLIDLLPEICKLLQAKEISVQKKSVEVIAALGQSAHQTQILSYLEQTLSKEYDYARKEKIQNLILRIKQAPVT